MAAVVTWVRRMLRRLHALFRNGKLDAELADEIRLHVELETEDLMRTRGLSRQEARRQAMVGFGGVERYREAHRDARGVRWIEQLAQDVKYGVRSLGKSAGFTITAVLTIALGVGVTTAVYSVVNRLLLDPLPFANADRWRVVGAFDNGVGHLRVGVGTIEMADWSHRATTLDAASIVFEHGGLLAAPDHWSTAEGADVAPSLFQNLGVRPVVGRLFGPSDATSDVQRVMVLSERFWRREFAGRADVVGRTVTIQDTAYTILGVVPDRLSVLANYDALDFWSPVTPAEAERFAHDDQGVTGVVELKRGVTAARAERELNLLTQQRSAGHGTNRPMRQSARLIRPGDVMDANLDAGLWVTTAAALLVLLIACANVAGLQLARAGRRSGELSVRAALGASRARLVRQLAVEGALLAAIGGAGGLLLGHWLLRLLVSFRPEQLRQLAVVRFDGHVVAVGLLLTVATSVLYSVAPAWYATGLGFARVLHGAARARVTDSRRRIQSLVIVSELALSVVLLAGAGLLTRSFTRMNAADPGFRPDGLLEVQVLLPHQAFGDTAVRAAFWTTLEQRTRSLPGVAQAMAVSWDMISASGGWCNTGIEVEGNPPEPRDARFLSSCRRVPGAYFPLLGIHVLAGHTFTAEDDRGETNNVVIGAGMARRFWPDRSAVGGRFRWSAGSPWLTVEGVVSDVALIGPSPENRDLQFYRPPPRALSLAHASGLMVRLTAGADEARMLSRLRALVASVDRHALVTEARSERSVVNDNLASPRFSTWLMDLFASMALVLAVIGLYGLVSFAVGQRTREIGVRMALGARASDVSRFVVADGVRLTLVGLALGLAVSLGATRLLASLLFDVSATDPVVFAVIPVALIGVSALASYLPARRAARVDPVIALRAE